MYSVVLAIPEETDNNIIYQAGQIILLFCQIYAIIKIFCVASIHYKYQPKNNSARIYRPCFRKKQAQNARFQSFKRAFWACFRENWVYKFGHRQRFKRLFSPPFLYY
jgi:hypothetical protein